MKKICAAVKEKWFEDANKNIAKSYPPLKKIIANKISAGISPHKVFIQCVNRLHDIAKILCCDNPSSTPLNLNERMIYERENYQKLIGNIHETIRRHKVLDEMLINLDASKKYSVGEKQKIKEIIKDIKKID